MSNFEQRGREEMSNIVDMSSSVALGEFISTHRSDLIARCLVKLGPTDPSKRDDTSLGIPAFLDQLTAELSDAGSKTREIRMAATAHGHNLFLQGFTASEVVHVYGSVCQAVTDLAVETTTAFTSDDFRTLNRCLDDAIAAAVSEYTRQQRIERDDKSVIESLESKNLLQAAITAFNAIQTGNVGVGGATGALLHRSLVALQRLI